MGSAGNGSCRAQEIVGGELAGLCYFRGLAVPEGNCSHWERVAHAAEQEASYGRARCSVQGVHDAPSQ
jgi:hypothetical protein